MKRSAIIFVACLLAATVLGQTSDDKRRADYQTRWARQEKLRKIEHRIDETRPKRRDGPLRDENITDDEVRQIQIVTQGVLSTEILNISGVVTGCPCEEGLTCSAQAWVSTHKAGKTVGVQLSRIDSHWKIGVIQTWWLEHDRLSARSGEFKSWWEYNAAVQSSVERFPACRVD